MQAPLLTVHPTTVTLCAQFNFSYQVDTSFPVSRLNLEGTQAGALLYTSSTHILPFT